MPEQRTIERAEKDAAEGKSPSTQAGEFVHEEMDHIREGKHGARSTKQAIAIGLSKGRRGGGEAPAPQKKEPSSRTREGARRDLSRGQAHGVRKPSRSRSRASSRALRREGHGAASQ